MDGGGINESQPGLKGSDTQQVASEFSPVKARSVFIEDLSSGTVPGAYALLHEASKAAWVGKGQSWIEGLTRNLRQLDLNLHGCRELQALWRPEQGIGGPARQFELASANGYYSSEKKEWEYYDANRAYRELWLWCQAQGYKMLSPAPRRWASVLEILEDPRRDVPSVGNGRPFLAVVWNKCGANKICGGVFQTVDAAREWSRAAFDEAGEAWEPKLSYNDLTMAVGPLLYRG